MARRVRHKRGRDKRVHSTRVLTLTERVTSAGQVRSAWVTDARIPAHGQARVFGEQWWRMV